MRRILLFIIAVTGLGCEAVKAETPPEAQIKSIEYVARNYLDALYALEFDKALNMLTADMFFEDTSATVFQGEPVFVNGREKVVDTFRNSATFLNEASYEIQSIFVNGSQVVMTLTYMANMKGQFIGIDAEEVFVKVPAVTILNVEDGKIASHTDYVGYETMLNQLQAAKKD